MMRRLWLLLPAGLLGPASLAALWLAGPGYEQAGAVYTVRAVQAGLARDPAAWLGRTVRVRGIAAGCLAARGATPRQSCARWPAYLVDAGEVGAFPLAWGSQGGVLPALRRLPLLGQLLPPPPTPRWGEASIYAVQLRATLCGRAPCYVALLLDAAP